MSNTSSGPSAINRSTVVTSRASTAAASPPTVRESIRLPPPQVIATSLTGILEALEAMKGNLAQQNDPSTKYPVIIGSRAAKYHIPSFRLFSDWDVVATPQQASDMIRQQEQEHNNSDLFKIKLIKQPLVHDVIKRRPMPADIQERIHRLPAHLYKISGQVTESFKFEIEVIDHQDLNSVHSSALMLLNLCNNAPPDELAYLSFSIGTGQRNQPLVAPVELLEALKTSHIYWPFYFEKHIADLHALRGLLAFSASSSTATAVNLGYHADKTKPLTTPARSPQVEEYLVIRTLEVEAFRGTPGAHINLNVSNEDFLGRDDDLFVARHIPHDDIHTMVMYGSEPCYDGLKTDKSKAMLSRALFEQAPYREQLHCVKEEAMVIALERFLVPKLTSDPDFAYRSALIRICTTLTKGWFRQFAVDNFPRLVMCDKDLLPIRDAILERHPAPVQTNSNTLELLKKSITNLDNLHIVQQLVPLGKATTLREIRSVLGFDTGSVATTAAPNTSYGRKRSYRGRREFDNVYTKDWVINSKTTGRPALLISFTSSHYWNGENCDQYAQFHGTLSVQALVEGITLDQIERPPADCQKAVADVSSEVTGSWGGEDIWGGSSFTARPLAANEVNMLDVDGLTEDLLMAYIVNLVQPALDENGDTPLQEELNDKMLKGLIPMPSHNHRWFDLWKYHKTSSR